MQGRVQVCAGYLVGADLKASVLGCVARYRSQDLALEATTSPSPAPSLPHPVPPPPCPPRKWARLVASVLMGHQLCIVTSGRCAPVLSPGLSTGAGGDANSKLVLPALGGLRLGPKSPILITPPMLMLLSHLAMHCILWWESEAASR